MTPEELTEELSRLLADLGEHRAAYLTGRAEHFDSAHVYGAHARLMLTERVRDLRARVRDGDEDARPLLNAVTRTQMLGGCAPVLDRISAALDREVLRGLEDKWFFCDTERRIGEEANRKQRKVLDQSRRRALARLEGALQEAVQQLHALMVDRGFTGYLPMCAELSGVDPETLLEEAEGFLEDSGGRYLEVLGEALREAGVFPEDARNHDMIYLFAGRYGPTAGFPDARPALLDTFSSLGLPLDAQPGLRADLDARETKRPGTWVVAERVPEMVHVIHKPETTWVSWPELWGAAGLAAGLAATPPDLPFARRNLIDTVLAEAFRAVFASLPGNPEWLGAHAPDVKAEAQVRRFHLWWLYRVRLLAGSARYARFLHGPGELSDKADAYEHYMHEAVGARLERDNYLHDTPWFFDQGLALKGQFLGAQILDVLEERFGPAWFAEAGAGGFLKGLWAHGWDRADRVAEACGIDEPGNVWPLTERLEGVLGEFGDDD